MDISALRPDDVVYSVTRQKAGNTMMSRQACHQVRVMEVHADHVVASWNGNPARKFYPREIRKWRRPAPGTRKAGPA